MTAQQTAHLIDLLDRSQLLLEDGSEDEEPRTKHGLLTIRLARNEVITQVLKTCALITALSNAQTRMLKAAQHLADQIQAAKQG